MRIGVGTTLVALLALGGSGCSLFLVKGPPNASGFPPSKECTTNYVLPVADVLLGLGEATGTAYALTASQSELQGLPTSRAVSVAGGVTFTALFAISSYIGFDQVSRCREAVAAGEAVPQYPPPEEPAAPANSAVVEIARQAQEASAAKAFGQAAARASARASGRKVPPPDDNDDDEDD
jgi:hypothetical protein